MKVEVQVSYQQLCAQEFFFKKTGVMTQDGRSWIKTLQNDLYEHNK